MKKLYWLPLVLIAALGIAYVAGCGSSDDKVLAQVGDYKITIKEFNDFARQLRQPFPTAQDEFSEKKKILDSMIVNRLLVQAAYQKGIDQNEDVARVVLANKDKFLLDVLYQRDIADKATVTDAELKDFYNKLEYKIRASHILVKSEDTANMLLDSIKNGANFEQLAYDHSIDPSAKRNRGDLGYFTYGAMVDEFQDAAFKMEPGEVSTPVKSKFGYHIIKLVDREKNDARKDFDSMKETLRQQLIRKKQGALIEGYMTQLKTDYAITVDTGTVQLVIHKRQDLYPPQVVENLPKWGFDVEQLDRIEREMPLATWNGGQMSLYQYLMQLQQVPEQYRPDLADYDSVATIIFRLKLNDFLVLEATKRGYDKDPEFKRKLQLFKELSMADVMRNDSLPQPLAPDEAELREYYENHKDKYSDPAKVHVYEIMLSDEILANKLAREIKTLEQFKEKASQLTERPAKRGTNGDLGFVERKWFPEIFDLAKKTPDGKIGGPVVNSGGKYSIFWVVAKTPERIKDYLDVKTDIRQAVVAERKSEAFTKWVQEQKDNTKITIHDNALWSTIDNSKYAAADDAAKTSNN